MPLPTFLICGAPKAGTTSLYRYVEQHPDVCMSAEKETGFFLENYHCGIDWLADTLYRHYRSETAIGEATTGMMRDCKAPRRIAKHLPDVKLLFVLRNPIDRIYSHFDFHRSAGVVPPDASFSDLIRDTTSEWRNAQIDLGMYHDHLTRYETHFDRAQMLVHRFDELTGTPDPVIRETYAFIGVDPAFRPDTSRRYNKSKQPRHAAAYRLLRRAWEPVKKRLDVYALNHTQRLRHALRSLLLTDVERPDMPDADRTYLRDIYAEPNARLADWLGTDLSHWT